MIDLFNFLTLPGLILLNYVWFKDFVLWLLKTFYEGSFSFFYDSLRLINIFLEENF